MRKKLDVLVGKVVKEIRMTPDNDYIEFATDDGSYAFITEGDCCSTSWIEHISGIEALEGCSVMKTDQVELEEEHLCEYQVISIYSFKLFTPNGVCEIEMRNSSNGYYGGYLDPTPVHIPPEQLITKDF